MPIVPYKMNYLYRGDFGVFFIDFMANRSYVSLAFRINNLMVTNEKLKIQLVEKDKFISNLQESLHGHEVGRSDSGARSPDTAAADLETAKALREETDAMHAALRDIAQIVINDADQQAEEVDAELSTSQLRSSSPLRTSSPLRMRTRSMSPTRRSRSPAFADSTFSAVQAALSKRQLQVQELRSKLAASKDSTAATKKNLDDVDNERRRMERQLMDYREELDNA